MKRTAILVAALFLAAFGGFPSVYAWQHSAADARAAAPATQALSEGVVRKVDKENAKLTIKHGPLENLGMPGMTMVFGVKDPAMLGEVKAGDAIRFRAEQVDGRLTVTSLQLAR